MAFVGFCANYNTDKIDIVENYEPGFECLKFPEADRCPSRYPSSEAYKCTSYTFININVHEILILTSNVI